jgi:uncharacterized protein (TIGR02453 family)
MGRGFPKEGITFLSDLAMHNDRHWFEANRDRYEQHVKEPARRLAEAISGVLKKVDRRHASDPAKAVSRIFRDVRFSADKTPYYTYVWFSFPLASGPKESGAAYYVGIDPAEGAGTGAGCWKPPPERMEALRARLAKQHSAFRKVVEDPRFRKRFGEIQGETYKKVPKPYPPDHPAGDLLKHKGMHVHGAVPLSVATSDGFLDVIAADFEWLAPMVRFLDKGLEGR